jgi:hypothetical protein
MPTEKKNLGQLKWRRRVEVDEAKAFVERRASLAGCTDMKKKRRGATRTERRGGGTAPLSTNLLTGGQSRVRTPSFA